MAPAGTDDEDVALLSRVRAGERFAFDRLVRRHQQGLFRLGLRYLHDQDDARDLVQRTFLKAFEGLGGLRGDQSFRAWLYRIAVNLALNAVRNRRRLVAWQLDEARAADAPTSPAQGPEALDRARQTERVRRAIAELPPKQRLAVELRVFDGLSFREVGQVAGCSEDAAKVNFHHGVKRLRSLLEVS